ncbi:murein hydrolase activator EnvC family protein [Blastococcus sp. PRF04-17]|uniref:murein hydrolase activator EnvC family protein n=1 Tax=Blastococcus sp. PRF04-17 TaxID=2933797 RepID=UPI001FF154DC|nr:M23 family metallopeptidase [Blastococcus sp. PRF04-17]UOY03128.1 peptidoglycan DD-metalloendopeptidase family protein [Blastococcus sp. PRF04-17]
MATLHHHDTPFVQPLHRRPRHRARRALVLAGLVAGALLATPEAAAAPGQRVAEARSAHDAAKAEVAAIAARVQSAEETLQRMTIEAEAASGEALAARAALQAAQTEAQETARELAAVRAAVERTQDDVSTIGREAYMGTSQEAFGDVALLLDANSPTELLQQAATLEVLGDERTEVLEELQAAEAREERLDRAARAAVEERDRLAAVATEAEAAANAQLAAAQSTFDAASAEKAALDAQLREAEIRLLGLQGARNPADTWASQQAAAATVNTLSAAGGAIAPTSGRVTSCYGTRWGTLHAGIDIAAPIGTPVYTPEDGVVLQAGAASGFGLAVAVQHGDGTITLYGHVNQMFVSAGQVVTAGQQIAEVGNRGQSTGPHLHFETHTGGLYANRVNPVPWLTARGISLGGGC